MTDHTAVSWRFDTVVVNDATFQLIVDGVPRPLEPKSFRLLQYLIENRERAVSKEEIFQAVWPGTFVTDNALTRTVAQIRKAIGDDPRQPRYIETIPTIGYRFTGRVEEVDAALPQVASTRSPRWPGRSMLMAAAALVILAAGLAVAWLRDPTTASDPEASFRPVQFSTSSGLDQGASFSPDGNLVAYASDKSGAFEIYVKSFDSSARELQLTSDGNQNLYPAFSPDGRWIAYASATERGIFRVPAIGGPVQRLTDFGVQPVWSPDGQTIVFRSSGAASFSATDYYWPAESSLWMVPTAGGSPVQLTGINGPGGGQSFPSFSPDGTEIRFVNHFKAEASIWTYRLADRSLRQLFASTRFPYSNATFAADGTRMWFISWELNGNIGIWELALDPSTLTPVGEPESLYPSPFAVPRDLALSADGTRLAFTAVLSESAIMAESISGDRSGAVTLTRDTTYRYGLPRSSPDGTRVVYASFPRNGFARQWMVNADGSQATAVGPDSAAGAFYGSLNPDNSRVFLTEFPAPDGSRPPGRVISQNLADRAVHTLGEVPAGASQATCSLDCNRLLFHNVFDERRRVYELNTTTGAIRVLASGEEDVGFARFSRDNKWISVEITHRKTGGADLAVMPATGGPMTVILKSNEPTYGAGWMPDNDRVLFAGSRGGVWDVYTVSRTSGAIERVTSHSLLRTYVRYPDWLAGDRVVYEFNETKGNIFVANVAVGD